MDRIREARRGTMTAVNGGLSRRRQRGSSLRDSPEEDGAMETQEAARLRDRGSKKDRDRERSNRKKRRRCDRMLHESHREGGQESSEDSVDEEEDDEEDDSSVVRMALLPAPNPTPSASLMQSHHLRKGYVANPVRPLGACNWKVVEEMIGAPIPRKARSSSVKRSQECGISGGCGGANVGGVGGDQLHWQTSTSPVRPSLSSTAPLSPSSSNASIRKNMTISGRKYRPPKPSKSSSIQEIEIEVAEVLFGMTRQVTLKKDSPKNDSKESNEVKSSVSSPIPISSPPPASQSPTIEISNPSSNSNPLTTTAPKRKRPSYSVVKLDKEAPLQLSAGAKTDPTYLVSENMASSTVENGGVSCDPVVSNDCSTSATLANMQQELLKLEGDADLDPKDTESQPEKKAKEEAVSPPKEESPADLDVDNLHVDLDEEDPPANKAAFISDCPRAEKINIDLMAPPSGKSSLEMDNTSNYVTERNTVEMEMGPKLDVSKGEIEKVEKKSRTKSEENFQDYGNGGRFSPEEPDSKKQAGKERNLELQLDLEKHEKDVAGARKHQAQKHQSRGPRAEPRTEKAGLTESLPLPMQIPGWPGGFPSFGYMSQVPLRPVGPVDASSSSSKTVQNFLPWQLRPKSCATHYYIAQNIRYHQQITRLNPFWPSAVGATPFYAAKQFNLTAVPSDSAILGNPLQGSLPGKSLGSVQEKEGSVFSAHSGLSTRDKNNTANPSIDASHKKPAILQQSSQPGSAAGNIIAPAFIFPLNQQQAAAAVAGVPNRSGVAKLTAGSSNAAQSSSSTSSAAVGAPGANGLGTTMSFNYPSLPPNEAQYLAFLQNNAYRFPIPAHVGGAPPYRGATPSQSMPFFNLSFYPSQMLHPSQFRSQQQPPSSLLPPCSQQGNQNPSTSSGSSSSQKIPQQSQRVPALAATAISACNSQGFPRSKHQLLRHPAGQPEYEAGGEDTPSTADSRVSQVQKTISTQKYAIPAYSQNFTLISPALTSLTSGGNHGEKQQPQIHNQVMKMDLTQSQALAMSFASFGGSTASAGGAAVQGLDFSSMAQNHALFQSLPEAARHGYQISAAAAHATQQQQQYKKPDVGKSAPELGSASTAGEKGKLSSVSSVLGSVQQRSHTFSRADSEPPISTILSNSVIDSSSRNLNLIQQPSSGAPRILSRPGSAAPAFNSSTTGSQGPNSHHLQEQHLQKQHLQHQQLQQQQLLQLQKQHQQLQQQQLHQQHRAKLASSHSNPSVYTDRLSGNSNASKLPQASPPALMQKSSASTQCPQWKAAPRAVTATSSAAPSPSASSSVKNQISLQQQVQSHQQPAHQTHISFGLSPAKVAGQAGQRLISSGSSNAVSLSCAAADTVGSSHTSVSKNSGSSPLPSSGAKSGPPPPVLPAVPLQKQQLSKNSSSPSSTISPLPVTNPNMPSILGFPHIINSTSNSSIKSHPSSQHQPPKQHLPQSPQFFFSNSYMQNQISPSDATIAYFQQHQRPPPDPQQSQQKEKPSPSAGILSLGPSSSPTMANGTSDPSKAAGSAPSGNSKGLQHQAQFTAATVSQAGSRAVHPLTPYLHNMQSVSSLKPAAATEQKPAAGNDNLHACWQPEKR